MKTTATIAFALAGLAPLVGCGAPDVDAEPGQALLAAPAEPGPTYSCDRLDEDEYDVLSAAMAWRALEGEWPYMPVIAQETGAPNAIDTLGHPLMSGHVLAVTTPGSRFPGPQPIAVALQDYLEKNRAPACLTRRLVLDRPYTLASPEWLAAIFAPPPVTFGRTSAEAEASLARPHATGWDLFYQTFPDATGLLTATRPGFDAGRDLAVVTTLDMFGSMGGESRWYLLTHLQGHWYVTATRLIGLR